jgi:Ca2+-binding EF-hand superfamily protein
MLYVVELIVVCECIAPTDHTNHSISLHTLYCSLPPLLLQELQAMIDEFDRDQDGEISSDEFT